MTTHGRAWEFHQATSWPLAEAEQAAYVSALRLDEWSLMSLALSAAFFGLGGSPPWKSFAQLLILRQSSTGTHWPL